MKIIAQVSPAYLRYPGQVNSQNAYVEIDFEGKTINIGVNGEIGNGVPFDVWHRRSRRYGIPSGLLPNSGNALMDEILPLAEKMLEHYTSEWNGSNFVGHLDDTGSEIEFEIEKLCEEYTGDCLVEYNASDFYQYDEDRLVSMLRGGMTRDALEAELDINKDDAGNPVTVYGLDYFLDWLFEKAGFEA